MKKISLLLSVVFILGFSSCLKEFTEDNARNDFDLTEIPEDFRFNTTMDYQVSITLQDSDSEPFAGVPTEIYLQEPYMEAPDGNLVKNPDVTPVMKGFSNENGKFETGLSLPSHAETIYVKPLLPGFVDVKALTLQSKNIEVVFGNEEIPEGEIVYADKKVFSPFLYLGDYNSVGYPLYKIPKPDKIDKELLEDIDASLPESKPLTETHPQYLEDNTPSNIKVSEKAEVFVTFVHEGAGYKNVLTYFHYPTDNPPATKDDVDYKIVAFPNVSLAGSGGALRPGDKVQLKYYNDETGEFEETFPAGTTIEWMLIADGFDKSVNSGLYQHYSIPSFNIEKDEKLQKHTIVLHDDKRDLLLVGFEDQRRDERWCDQDFNDAIFYVTANPFSAIDTKNMKPVDTPEDNDEDGVSNTFDEFPDDPELAYKVVYPAEDNYGTLAYEDLWPYKGDYDFNDVVIDYRYSMVRNAKNEIKYIDAEFKLRAIGAGFHNGFGFQIGISPDEVISVSGQKFYNDYISLNANGTEAGQKKATIIVFDNAYGAFGYPATTTFINTVEDGTQKEVVDFNLRIELAENTKFDTDDLPPYNPFIISNLERGREVHLPGSEPTDLANPDYFGTGQDYSVPEQGIYYVTKDDLPWGMNIPVSFSYPLEKTRITEAYNLFESWAKSGGYNNMDWYLDKSGYINKNKIMGK